MNNWLLETITSKTDASPLGIVMFNQCTSDTYSGPAIIKAIIGLGHTLDMQVIAEGVEKEDEYRALRAAGCDGIQGYFVARPLPPEQVPEWLGAREMGGQTA